MVLQLITRAYTEPFTLDDSHLKSNHFANIVDKPFVIRLEWL